MLRNAIKYGTLSWLLLGLLVYGCATVSKIATSGAGYAVNAVATATGLLGQLDGYYDRLVEKKTVPAIMDTATKVLSNLDQAAKTLQDAAAGKLVTDANLNAAAGAVVSGQAVADQLK